MAAPSAAESRGRADALHEEILHLLRQGADARELEGLLARCGALPEALPGRASLLACARAAIELGATIRQHQQRERGLLAVSETAATLTQLRSLQDVLQGIARRGRQLLGSHVAWLAGIDREAGSTFVIAIDGGHTEAVRSMRVPLDTGIAGKVIGSGLPFWTSNYGADDRLVHQPDIDRTLQGEGLQAAAGVPLFLDGQVAGVLIVADRYARTYLPWEVAALATLASHAAAAMRNAQAFEEARAALQAAEQANLRLQQQTAAVEFAATAHERLTLLVVKGGGVQELAGMVRELLAATTVAVLDEVGHVLCTEGREAVAATGAQILAAMGESRARGQSIEVPGPAGSAWVSAAGGGAAGLMGAIVLWRPTPLAESELRVLERSSMVLSLILLSQERRRASAREEAGYVVGTLLNPWSTGGGEWVERSLAMGLDPRQPTVVAAVQVEGARLAHVSSRLAAALQEQPALVAELDGRIVAVLGGDDLIASRDRLQRALSSMPQLNFLGAVGMPRDPQERLASVHEKLKRCLALLRALGRSNTLVVEAEFAPYAQIFDQQGLAGIPLFVQATIGALLEHDARRGTHLAETLLAYLDSGYGAKATAATLGIHVNTLVNRLDAVDEVLGAWKEQKRGAEIHLALRLWRLRSAA